jgi:hypothetical protein
MLRVDDLEHSVAHLLVVLGVVVDDHVKGVLGHGAGEAVRVVIAIGGGVAGHSTAHGFRSFVLAGLHAMQESSILRSLPQE